jgi:hypothetical protein
VHAGGRSAAGAGRAGLTVLALAAAFLFLQPGCAPDERTARGVAERFIDAHYVQIDRPLARTYCTGLALHKLDEEERLTQGQVIDETTRKPRIRYSLREEHPIPEGAVRFVYEATIAVEDAGQFTRKFLITVRRDGDAWKVSNFEEYD